MLHFAALNFYTFLCLLGFFFVFVVFVFCFFCLLIEIFLTFVFLVADLKRRISLLSYSNVTKASELTPKAKNFYKIASENQLKDFL